MPILRFLAGLLALALSACAANAPPPATAVAETRPAHPVILISVDGLRADYLRRGVSPNITALAARGVTTSAMRPSFPSLTFPNHYTLVTGLRPDRHGVVNNTMRDAELGAFSMGIRSAVEDARWWNGAEPIWVTAERAAIPTATMFWPGSEAAVRGVRPHRWLKFDGAMPNRARVDQLLAWLDERPQPGFATLYFDTVDHDGHEHGPDSPQLNAAVSEVDARIGDLLAGLKARGIAANIILVADHGMAQVSSDRRIFLDSLLESAQVQLVAGGAVASLNPQPGQERAVKAALLRPHPHMACHEKADLPARLHYGRHARVPAILCIADSGWTIWLSPPRADQPMRALGGMHGFDPAHPDMAASFVAAGPAFRSGVVLPPFDNVDVHPLLLRLLGLPAMQTDGGDTLVRGALR
ncbi:ectonucleotide pyrophosphatase/phosphodiesterase [Sandarakinorhabdus sp. AAP62]|uniref:alkaline phosphatase family protein n=1 Tax=Sandarakinorhabdus sp. AAP62 TaxID=1248916 RepID=UPI0019D362C2|nr:ectonucleotide pyrophosphatase/phosphodiesterase [Sandarakinorhabdus sp. AAP62]